MGAVTYSSGNVIRLLNDEVVAVQLPHTAQPETTDYNVKWTPAMYILDPTGLEHHNIIGFLPPEEFIPFVMLGIAKSYFDMEKHDEALAHFEKIVEDYPQSSSAPEAVYLRGVTHYKIEGTVDGLVGAYETLSRDYPGTVWASRSEPYRLLKAAA
ncbi:MAG: tetratricopeptide repeat protein [Actinobacteria bacterium]|nr:tetratricopeptide repeat protein [Actinomycetota bacterium]MCL5882823.1 tetratricopeptide repeat protein [Actinomycetota bacterium]